MRKGEQRIRVIAPDGSLNELPYRNAYDLINHHGWKLEVSEDQEVNEKAKAPRNVRKVADQLKEKLEAGKEKEDEKPNTKKRSAKPKGVGTRKRNKVPAKKNVGPGPAVEEDIQVLEQAGLAALDDLDMLEQQETKRGNVAADPANEHDE